jgi:hypothetical protein
MAIRRLPASETRSSLAKKVENHATSVAIHTTHYNLARLHQTLRCIPAMAAGVTTKLWELSDLVKVLEDRETRQFEAV